MVDAHAWFRMGDRSYTPELIEDLAREMAAYNITWLEEPLPPEDHDAYIALCKKRIVPVAAGEHETSLEGFEDLISRGAVNIAQSDPAHQGGYHVVRRVLQACARENVEFAFHNWGTLLECLAAAHLGVCFPEETCAWLEYPCFAHRRGGEGILYPYPLADEILREPLSIDGSDLILPDGPGLGIDVDESVVEKYPYQDGPMEHLPPRLSGEVWASQSPGFVARVRKGGAGKARRTIRPQACFLHSEDRTVRRNAVQRRFYGLAAGSW